MLRSCLRAVEAISRIPGVNACEPWRNFMQVHDHAVGCPKYGGEPRTLYGFEQRRNEYQSTKAEHDFTSYSKHMLYWP